MVQAEDEKDWAIYKEDPGNHCLHVDRELLWEWIVVHLLHISYVLKGFVARTQELAEQEGIEDNPDVPDLTLHLAREEILDCMKSLVGHYAEAECNQDVDTHSIPLEPHL